jgi:hypothetical protein
LTARNTKWPATLFAISANAASDSTSSSRTFDALDGQVFVKPAAAQRAVALFSNARQHTEQHRQHGG